ncbi:unnamed protein product [Spirodela intermedia]|uniref:Uncharacterized protein n=1 Tax=Spirodela intermedia TaxID=51605 RepID=A0A7I8J2G7_SPIIN|nr:unnamed protein product [Spirodela intermedia]CAA6664416.1 unnamed protein product [Spirodela intermedia]
MHGRRFLHPRLENLFIISFKTKNLKEKLFLIDPEGSIGQTENNPMAIKNYYIPDSFQRASNIRVPLAPTIKFEINSRIFQMISNFHGLPLEEPHQHLEKFHMVCDLINLPQTEKFKDLLRKCPHHAILKWQLNRIFYDGLLEQYRNIVDSICGGAFMEKTPDEIYNLYENLSENSKDQASFKLYDKDKKRGIYELHHNNDSNSRNEVNQINQRLEKLDLFIEIQVTHNFIKNREYFSNSYNPN